MKISVITSYKIIAAASFIVLACVQFFLVYNTYELKNEHFFLAEKQAINADYGQSIQNDKLFPGGSAIVDVRIYNNIDLLEKLYHEKSPDFYILKQKVCDSIFNDLRKANNFDSLLLVIKKKRHFNNKLSYKLTVGLLDIAFQSNKYVPLFGSEKPTGSSDSDLQKEAWIGGDLKKINLQNRATLLTVSSTMGHSYRMTFSLFVDRPNRTVAIITQMMPVFLLSLFSVLFLLLIFYFTFRNWVKQKKISEMKSDFINSITHEFHTPLAAIIVANKTLQNEKINVTRENILPLTEVIQRQSQRLKILFEQVLDITTMNQIKLTQKLCSISLVLEEILLDYRLKSANVNLELIFKKGVEKDQVMMDQFWFTTIVLNILDNAVKYNDLAQKQIIVSTYNDKKNLYVSIADNGIGMTEETQKNIFEKFYRSPHNINGQVKGVGLGLYYAKQAVDVHNWAIDIKSMIGEGSVFTITIPY